jgi:hypothetical protein
MVFEVSSVPLSLTIIFGLPHLPSSRSSSRATRMPEIEGIGRSAPDTRAHHEDAHPPDINELVSSEVH